MPGTRLEHDIRTSQSAASDLFKTGIDVFRTGLERTVDVQKHVLDVAAQQNADIADMWKRTFRSVPGAEPMFDLAEQIVGQFLETQKGFLDLIAQQTLGVTESTKTQGERTARVVHGVAESATTQRERPKSA